MKNREGISRRDFLKIGLAGSALFLEACKNLTPEEIKNIPLSDLDDVIKNPEKYAQADKVKVLGYLAQTGKEVEHDETLPNKYGPGYDIASTRYRYKIGSKPDMSGQALDAVSEAKITNFDSSPFGWDEQHRDDNRLGRDFPKEERGERQQIIGRFRKAKKERGVKYIFEIGKSLPEAEK
jgi:hypothetical protein